MTCRRSGRRSSRLSMARSTRRFRRTGCSRTASRIHPLHVAGVAPRRTRRWPGTRSIVPKATSWPGTREGLIPKLESDFGNFAAALVIAHEWGHAIQQRTGTSSGATIPLELQADCFAGAWAKHATTTNNDAFNVKPGDLEQALSGYLYFSDPVGTNPGEQGAHGSAFDRIDAFSDGYSHGVKRCKDYETNPPTITEIPFTSSGDLANQGNLPFAELVSTVRTSLDSYWKSVLDATPVKSVTPDAQQAAKCGATAERPVVACANRTVAYNSHALRAAYDRYGDYAAALLLAEAWADAAAQSGKLQLSGAPVNAPGNAWPGHGRPISSTASRRRGRSRPAISTKQWRL